jgi:hypothetical protein
MRDLAWEPPQVLVFQRRLTTTWTFDQQFQVFISVPLESLAAVRGGDVNDESRQALTEEPHADRVGFLRLRTAPSLSASVIASRRPHD